jgi:hypothetical protein
VLNIPQKPEWILQTASTDSARAGIKSKMFKQFSEPSSSIGSGRSPWHQNDPRIQAVLKHIQKILAQSISGNLWLMNFGIPLNADLDGFILIRLTNWSLCPFEF